MSVSFSPVSTYFKSQSMVQPKRENVTAPSVEPEMPKKKKGFLTGIKNGFVNFRKGLIDVNYMFLGAVKGVAYGAVAGLATLGGVVLRNIVKNSPKTLGLGGKVLASAVALGTLGITMFNAKLDANKRKSDLDHSWRTGHNEGAL